MKNNGLQLATWVLFASMAVTACGGSSGGGAAGPVDDTPPLVLTVDPPDTAVGALVQGPVVAVFSEDLDDASVTVSSFTLVGPDGAVPGTVTLNGATASFTPDNPLRYHAGYEAQLTTAIQDTAGNQLEADYNWRFDTGRKLAANFAGHTCARRDDGGLKCWGQNSSGALGLGDTGNRGDDPDEMGNNLPAVDPGTGRSVLSAGVGSGFTCALLDDRNVKCWGRNTEGQLGQGHVDPLGDESGEMGDDLPAIELGSDVTVMQLSVGSSHACVRLQGGAVKCWGNNAEGQLGLGDIGHRGDDPGEMGDNLPTVNLGTGLTAVSVIAADRYTCALLNDASLKCWGLNSDGDLGLGDDVNRGGDPDEMGDGLPVVELGAGLVLAELASDEHNCARFTDGSVKCWAYNFDGQLGLGDTDNRGDTPGEMGDDLPFVDLGVDRTAKAITVGSRHSCAILDDDTLKCWGRNSSGQLGLEDTEARGDEAGEMGDTLPTVNLGIGLHAVELAAGDSHTCARLNDDTIKCWGINGLGQLGLGDTENRGDEANEMGDFLPVVDLGS